MNQTKNRQPPDVQVETRGLVPPNMVAYAESKIKTVATRTRRPVLSVKVKLTQRCNPDSRLSPALQASLNTNTRPDRGAYAPAETAIAQATINVNGRRTRAQAASETMHTAIDLLKSRLEQRLSRTEQHWEARRGGAPAKEPREWRHSAPIGQHWKENLVEHNEWRHGDEPTHRPDYYPRPAEERELIRHKAYSLAQETPDEAAFEMESMDYDFHLFTDIASGQDSVIYRVNPHGYRVAQVEPRPDLVDSDTAVPLTLSDVPAPVMSVPEAEKRLDITGFPFVFFANADTGRGNILYHRYDGHYGLITPSE